MYINKVFIYDDGVTPTSQPTYYITNNETANQRTDKTV